MCSIFSFKDIEKHELYWNNIINLCFIRVENIFPNHFTVRTDSDSFTFFKVGSKQIFY